MSNNTKLVVGFLISFTLAFLLLDFLRQLVFGFILILGISSVAWGCGLLVARCIFISHRNIVENSVLSPDKLKHLIDVKIDNKNKIFFEENETHIEKYSGFYGGFRLSLCSCIVLVILILFIAFWLLEEDGDGRTEAMGYYTVYLSSTVGFWLSLVVSTIPISFYFRQLSKESHDLAVKKKINKSIGFINQALERFDLEFIGYVERIDQVLRKLGIKENYPLDYKSNFCELVSQKKVEILISPQGIKTVAEKSRSQAETDLLALENAYKLYEGVKSEYLNTQRNDGNSVVLTDVDKKLNSVKSYLLKKEWQNFEQELGLIFRRLQELQKASSKPDIELAYEALNVPAGISKRRIREAYKNLARIWHPDIHSGNVEMQKAVEEKMKLINWAYELLEGRTDIPE